MTSNAAVLLAPQPVTSIDRYLDAGGGQALRAARELGAEAVIDALVASGLRGRGGAGFPTGAKWRSVREGGGTHHYAVCNAAEGEPATFKDRTLIRANPYQVVEGLLVAALAVGAERAYVVLKESFRPEREVFARVVAELDGVGLLGGLDVHLAAGPEEYLLGEEKALLEVVEGREPLPRLLPPYLHGLFATAPQMGWSASSPEPGHAHGHESNPTLVNNVETLANVPNILTRGADWFRSLGTEQSPGTVVCTVVGDVGRPGVVEVEMGTPLSEVIVGAGGVLPGRRFKAAFSGVANPVVIADHVDVRLSYEAMEAIGSGLGAAGFCVYDDTACMVRVAVTMSRFLYVESCNQCPACKFGTGEITSYLERIDAGTGSDEDVERIGARLHTVTDGNRCYLPVQEQRVISSVLREFPEEFAEHLEGTGCPRPRDIPVPKIVDLVDGEVVYDQRQEKKQPDWTYAD